MPRLPDRLGGGRRPFGDANQKIVHLDIYEQAKDSGGWIVAAAEAATAVRA